MVEATSSLPPIRYWVDVILTTAWQCQRFDSERLERLRPQPAGKTGGEHAYPDAFDDPPDAIKLLLVDHKGATRGTILRFRVRSPPCLSQ